VPPEDLGISTALTGGGKYVPDDIRFQTLATKISSPGMPGALSA
jgi:hypothetical protein